MDLEEHSDEDEEEVEELAPLAASTCRAVTLGSLNHETVSQSRHTPHSSILEILENVLRRDSNP